ncbi:MAG TPA: hypothetical protein VE988_25550 [Gemmataceae bacterium]|nr:hypothetical protein [Gemmataceae bacterium]
MGISITFSGHAAGLSAKLAADLRDFRLPLETGAIIHREHGLLAETNAMFDAELLTTLTLLAAAVLSGGLAIYAAYRWYRTLKQPASSTRDDLAQLRRALKEQRLDPDEAARILAAIERQKSHED